MPDEKLPLRSLQTTALITALLFIICYAYNLHRLAYGIIIGTSLGMFSLGTLYYVVPKLFMPGKAVPKFFLGLVTALKLPIFIAVIYYATTKQAQIFIHPFGIFVGVGMVPFILTLKVLGWQLTHNPNETPGR